MYKFNTYWTDELKANFLERVIAIHSYLYYERDNSIWTDKHFDEISKQLVSVLKQHNEKLANQQSKLDAHQAEIEKNVANISKIVVALKVFKEKLL